MRFNSVKEYFYKLNSRGYQLMMIPLIFFIFYYSQWVIELPELVLVNKEVARALFFGICIFSGISLTAVQALSKLQANRIAREVGLGIKLEKLGTVLTRKMVALSILVAAMPFILLITGDGYFSISFAVLSLWYFLQWPTPARVCRLLKLRGDEKEMVISRGEAFR